jgi:adenine C2-methylase RlmN of 23S rRNA A2503 and tRNA A37
MGVEAQRLMGIVYRVAVKSLKNLDDPPECEPEEDPTESVSVSVNSWKEATFSALSRRKDVPADLASAIAENIAFVTTKLISNVDSSDGGTSKLLIETHDGHRVEAVVLRRHGRATSICVSSQVGCQMGCQFCATGTMGIIGNLTASEILEQAVYMKLAPSVLRSLPLKNIVFMGMGEPLNNFKHVKDACVGFMDFNRFGLGRAHITVSTVGVVPNMLRLNNELPGIPLALSLHAPNQKLREQIVPAAKAWPMEKLMAALDSHIEMAKKSFKKDNIKFTGVMIEYVLLSGVNDLPKHATELSNLLTGKPVLINLIPYNPNVTADMYGFEAPTKEDAYAFGKILIDRGLHARVRIERGGDIQAACGQLALTKRKTGEGYKRGETKGNYPYPENRNDGSKLVHDMEDLFSASSAVLSGKNNNIVGDATKKGGRWRRNRRSEKKMGKEEEEEEEEEEETLKLSEEGVKREESGIPSKSGIYGVSSEADLNNDDTNTIWVTAAAVSIIGLVAAVFWRRKN